MLIIIFFDINGIGYNKLLPNTRSIIVLYSSMRSKLKFNLIGSRLLDKYTHVVNPIDSQKLYDEICQEIILFL